MHAIFIFRAFRETTAVSREAAAQLGNFVGGYVGSLFALLSVLLLWLTLKRQVRSSSEQSFESKYFELLKMHRDNVAEIALPGASGRKVFVCIISELRSILKVVRSVSEVQKRLLTKRQVVHVAYYCLFYGVGPNSSRMLRESLRKYDEHFIDAIEKRLNCPEVRNKARGDGGFEYTPFEGHQSRLGHYYRHLYQMVRYVDERQFEGDKYEYIKTIRAQLSTHEQALLLVNSLTPVGNNWWLKDLIVKYRLVQNLPREFFDSVAELDVGELFDADYFEWKEAEGHTTAAGRRISS